MRSIAYRILHIAAGSALTLIRLTLILTAAIVAHAQTYSVLYNFGTDNAGNVLYQVDSITQTQDGNFYGTGAGGANGNGAVFKITPAGKAATLYSFTVENGFPQGLTLGSDGDFYGTAGDVFINFGSIFKITTAGSFTPLYSFTDGNDGAKPSGGLIQASDGNFYGTTCGLFYCYEGSGEGTIYKITPSGTFTPLYQFDDTHGAAPNGPLVQGNDGNFYGTTFRGGTSGNGVIYQVTPAGQLTVLYNYATYGNVGAFVIQGSDGNFYGPAGGGTSTNCSGGCGIIFRLTPAGNYSTFYNFDGTHGSNPTSLLQAKDGTFYGVTFSGGTSTNCTGGCGTIYKLASNGTYSVLYNFDDAHGSGPTAFEADSIGNFYGTTISGGSGNGGANDCGTATCGVLYTLVIRDFSVAASAFTPSTINAGASTTSSVNVASAGGFAGPVALSCSVQPAPPMAPKCSMTPSSASPGSTVMLTVSTTGTSARVFPPSNGSSPLYGIWLSLAGLLVGTIHCGWDRVRKRRLLALAFTGMLSLGLISQSACGGGKSVGGGGSGTPAGAYTITVNGASGSLQHSTTTMLTVE